MSTLVIATNETLMNTLRSSLQSCQLPLHDALLRQPGQSLTPLLPAVDHGLLLLDTDARNAASDLAALESWLKTRPQLNVLLFCEDTSKTLLMRAMRAGVREVMPVPPPPLELVESLQRWSDPMPGGVVLNSLEKQGRLVAFMGCKGGNGTTFVAANVAHLMATEFDRPCALVDLDLQCGDASFYLSSGAHNNSLSDLSRQVDQLDAQLLSSCMHAVTPQLNLLAAPKDLESAMSISPTDMEKIMALVRTRHEHVVVDLPRHLSALSLKVLDLADVIYIVMQNNTPDVRDAQRMVNMLRSLGYSDQKLRLLVNRYASDGWVNLTDLEKTVNLKVSRTIPSNPQWVDESLHTGKPLALIHGHNAVIHALRETTSDLLERPLKTQRSWVERWFGQAA